MLNSTLFKLNLSDFTKGLVIVVLSAVLASLQQAISGHGLDVASYDWHSISNMAIGAGLAYISKNFLSDSTGKVLGKIG